MDFYAEPGTRISFTAGPAAMAVSFVADDDGVLAVPSEYAAQVQASFAESESHPITQTPPSAEKKRGSK